MNSCQSILWIIISALDECDKQGDSCPSGLQCLKQANRSHVCGCSAGYKVIGEGEWRSCQGIIAKGSYPVAIYVYLRREKWEKTGVRLRHAVSWEGTRASFKPHSSLTRKLLNSDWIWVCHCKLYTAVSVRTVTWLRVPGSPTSFFKVVAFAWDWWALTLISDYVKLT